MQICLHCGSLNKDNYERCVICGHSRLRPLNKGEDPSLRSVLLLAYHENPLHIFSNPKILSGTLQDVYPLVGKRTQVLDAVEDAAPIFNTYAHAYDAPSVKRVLSMALRSYPLELCDEVEEAFEAVYRAKFMLEEFIANPKLPHIEKTIASEGVIPAPKGHFGSFEAVETLDIELQSPSLTFYKRGLAILEASGDDIDYAEAVRCFQRAAEMGDMNSHYELGKLYERGLGVERQSMFLAIEHYQEAVRCGHPSAQYALGEIYYQGKGVQKDIYEAARLFGLSAAQENPSALTSLGVCYYFGHGVLRDYSEAHRLFCLGAKLKSINAMYNLGHYYIDGLAQPFDYAEGLRWLMKAAEYGHIDAQYELGRMYYFGLHVRQNSLKAMQFLHMAVAQGHVGASNLLNSLR